MRHSLSAAASRSKLPKDLADLLREHNQLVMELRKLKHTSITTAAGGTTSPRVVSQKDAAEEPIDELRAFLPQRIRDLRENLPAAREAARQRDLQKQIRKEVREGNKDIPTWLRAVLAAGGKARIEDVVGHPLGDLLGCAHFGCVFQSDGEWVVKITRDPTEGPMWSFIKGWVEETPWGGDGVAQVKKVVRITPDITMRGKTWPVYAIVREEMMPVTADFGFSTFTFDKLASMARGCSAVDLQNAVGFSGVPGVSSIISTRRVHSGCVSVANEFNGAIVGVSKFLVASRAWHEAALLKREHLRRQRQERAEDEMDATMNLFSGRIGDPLGGFIHQMRHDGIILRDVHLANIGWRMHDVVDSEEMNDGLIVSDPGHTPSEQISQQVIDAVQLRGTGLRGIEGLRALAGLGKL